MSDSAFWHDLAPEFTPEDPVGGFGYRWQQTTAGDGFRSVRATPPAPKFTPCNEGRLQLKFERLARKAGFALDPSGQKDSLQVGSKPC